MKVIQLFMLELAVIIIVSSPSSYFVLLFLMFFSYPLNLLNVIRVPPGILTRLISPQSPLSRFSFTLRPRPEAKFLVPDCGI
jgi:hypothetical protein